MLYFISPELLRKLDFKGSTTLRGIEKHRLRELILRDLEIYRREALVRYMNGSVRKSPEELCRIRGKDCSRQVKSVRAAP